MIKHIELEYKENKYIRGYLDIPQNFNSEIVVMFHGYTGNKTEHGFIFRDFSRLLSENGFASIRMDLSGNGESDGLFREFTFDTAFHEIDLIMDFVRTIEKVEKIIFLGFSMGGALAASLVNKYNPDKLILWSGAGNIRTLIRGRYEKAPKNDNEYALSARDFVLSKKMYESLENFDPYKDLDKYQNKALVVCGTGDLAVPYEYGVKFSKVLKNSKLVIIEKGTHGYDNPGDKEKLFRETLNFLK